MSAHTGRPPRAGGPDVAEDTVVDGRYRVLGPLGSGGMADVLCVEDVHLGRRVALKVLHARYARDEQFVERFRREASAAAGLQHRHIVNVFDRGEHDGTYYIAMELLHGRQLKDIVADEGPLPVERAIDLTVQVLEAAAFAHRGGVVHRDFKPQNVMVDDQGQVKVTDFGIARAGASEMTETGSILGTAQYLSPEQAQGRDVREASDQYSIGVMLYEMLTGQLPFTGDSAVAIAVKHLNEAPTSPRALRPDLPADLEAVALRALAKDPAHRFADAEEFAATLLKVRAGLGHGGDGASVLPPLPVLPPLLDEDGVPIEALERPGRRRRAWIALGVLAVVVAGLLAYFGLRGGSVELPNLTGRQLAPATAELERQGLRVQVLRVTSPAPAETVVGQAPGPGTSVDPGSSVTLRVSSGPGDAAVPSVRKLPKRRAVQKLNEAGFNVEERPQASTSVRRGLAVRTTPPEGERLEKGSRVRLFVSTGPRKVGVPNLVGLSRDDAEARLRDLGLSPAVRSEPSGEPLDQVLSQEPDGGVELNEGSMVTLVVSDGPTPDAGPTRRDPSAPGTPGAAPSPSQASVPAVGGLSEAEARRAVEGAGLSIQVRDRSVSSPDDDGVVLSQRPAAGRRLTRGRTVVVYVGRADGVSVDGGAPGAP